MQSIVSRRDFRKLKNAVFVGCRAKALPSARVGQINIGIRHGGAVGIVNVSAHRPCVLRTAGYREF